MQSIWVAGSGATPDPTPVPAGPPAPPPAHVIVPDSDGWIEVDQAAIGNAFLGALIGFNTTQAFPDGAPPAIAAGTAVPVADQKHGRDIAIVFEATRVGVSAPTPDYSNTLARIHINNWSEVNRLNLLQFHTGGGNPCSPLSTDLDIEYTADHELMEAWSITLITAATPAPTPTLPSGAATRDSSSTNIAAGTHHENIASWPSCSYAIRLNTTRSLTTGLSDAGQDFTQLTFCK
jgi:hypothetical protein